MTAFLAKFYEVIIYFLSALLVISLCFVGYQWFKANHYKVKSDSAEAKCNTEKAEIHTEYKEQVKKEAKAYQKALAEQQSTINQLSSDYETEKSKYKVKVETVTKYADKIIERDVYRNVCIDSDGMQSINSLIKSRSTG